MKLYITILSTILFFGICSYAFAGGGDFPQQTVINLPKEDNNVLIWSSVIAGVFTVIATVIGIILKKGK